MSGEQHVVSDNEWTLMRIMERVMAPLVVATIVGGLTAYLNLSNAQAQTTSKLADMTKDREEIVEEVKTIKTQQTTIIKSQHQLDIQMTEMRAHVQNQTQKIDEMKAEQREILQLLRNQR